MMRRTPSAPSQEEATLKYICGIDMVSQSYAGCMCRPDKRVVIKSITFPNTREGWQIWEEKLNQLDASPNQVLIGMEATSRYGENLSHELEQRGYVLRLFHPGQTHHFQQQPSLRAKTDRLDAMTIARALLSGEARMGYVPGEQVTTYRELVCLHTHLADTAASYRIELFDIYRGQPIPAGHKSLAFRLTYENPEAPLKESQIVTIRNRIIQRVKDSVGGILRE